MLTRPRRAATIPDSRGKQYGHEVCGRRVKIFWAGDVPPTWFEGIVHSIGADERHLIRYDDGENKWHNLGVEEASDQLQWITDAQPPLLGGKRKRKDETKIEQVAKVGKGNATKVQKASTHVAQSARSMVASVGGEIASVPTSNLARSKAIRAAGKLTSKASKSAGSIASKQRTKLTSGPSEPGSDHDSSSGSGMGCSTRPFPSSAEPEHSDAPASPLGNQGLSMVELRASGSAVIALSGAPCAGRVASASLSNLISALCCDVATTGDGIQTREDSLRPLSRATAAVELGSLLQALRGVGVQAPSELVGLLWQRMLQTQPAPVDFATNLAALRAGCGLGAPIAQVVATDERAIGCSTAALSLIAASALSLPGDAGSLLTCGSPTPTAEEDLRALIGTTADALASGQPHVRRAAAHLLERASGATSALTSACTADGSTVDRSTAAGAMDVAVPTVITAATTAAAARRHSARSHLSAASAELTVTLLSRVWMSLACLDEQRVFLEALSGSPLELPLLGSLHGGLASRMQLAGSRPPRSVTTSSASSSLPRIGEALSHRRSPSPTSQSSSLCSLSELTQRFMTPLPSVALSTEPAAAAAFVLIQSRIACVLMALDHAETPPARASVRAASATACRRLAPMCERLCGPGSAAGLQLAADSLATRNSQIMDQILPQSKRSAAAAVSAQQRECQLAREEKAKLRAQARARSKAGLTDDEPAAEAGDEAGAQEH